MKFATLNSGVQLPLVALGTWRLTGYDTIHAALDAALKCGYRYIDSAAAYENEADIQKALVGEGGLLRKHGLTRDDIFITSKLSAFDMEHVDEAINKSIANFGGRIDLYLIHWPGNAKWQPDDPRQPKVRREAWLRLENAKQRGALREIGVSNYMRHHIEELLTYCSVKPVVNQCERHPFLTMNELIDYCGQQGIHFQAYSSLGSSPGDANNPLFANETVRRVAEKHGVSVSQVLLRYSVQRGVSVCPKSTSESHLAANLKVFDFELDASEVNALDGLNRGKRFCWDPELVK